MPSYLVTGGCGFIGSALANRLHADGHRVRVLDDLSTGRMNRLDGGIEVTVGDVTEAATVTAALKDVDGCFHLAAIASVERCNRDWSRAHVVNLGGFVTLLEANHALRPRAPIPMVYASSAAVYGESSDRALDEQTPPRPRSPYGADKLACELQARAAAIVRGMPTVGLRFFNVYGPGQDPSSPYSGVISRFAESLLSGRPIAIHGDGRQTRDFVFVDDVVRSLIAAFEYASTEAPVLNVCTGRPLGILDLARQLATLAGAPGPQITFTPPRPGDIRHSVGDPRRLAATLGVRCDTDLDSGLKRTLSALMATAPVREAPHCP